MAKLILNDVADLTNFTTAETTINNNSAAIEVAMENTLSRDGTTPNTMGADFDMNSNHILNLPQAVLPTEPVRLQEVGNAPALAAAAAASAAAALVSQGAAATSASTASTQAGIATTQAGIATTQATNASNSAVAAAASATVVAGNFYNFASSTVMADPSSANVRFNNATLSSVTALAFSVNTADTGNPSIRSYLAAWGASSNTIKGAITIRKVGTPSTFAIFNVTAASTDNTTWVQQTVAHVTSAGTFSAADSLSVQFTRAGDAGSVSGPGTTVDSEIVLFNGTSGNVLKRASNTGVLKATAGVIATATAGTDYLAPPAGTAILKANSGGALANATAGTDYLAPAAIGTTVQAFDAQLFSNIPQNSQSAAYTAVAADAQKHIFHPTADNNARTFTIPANSSVAYPIGTAITFINKINTVTIAITTDTLTLAGQGTTGSRTLAANGIATAIKIATTEWIISGTGLT